MYRIKSDKIIVGGDVVLRICVCGGGSEDDEYSAGPDSERICDGKEKVAGR